MEFIMSESQAATGILSGLREEFKSSNSAQNGGATNGLSFAIRLLEIEADKYFIGTRMDTGENVRVYLRPTQQNPNAKFKRPEAHDYCDMKSKVYSKLGEAVVQFDKVKVENADTNEYSANWANPIVKKREYAHPMCSYGQLSVTKAVATGDIIVKFRVINNKNVLKVENSDQMDAFLMDAFTPKFQYAKPFVILKISEIDDSGVVVDCEAYWVSPKMVEAQVGENTNYIEKLPADPIESLELFKQKRASIYNLIDNSNVIIELFSGSAFSLGSDTREKILNLPNDVLKITKDAYKIDPEADDDMSNLGFSLTNFAIKDSENTGRKFISFIKPNDYFAPTMKLVDVPLIY
jgi:hypothetical protein